MIKQKTIKLNNIKISNNNNFILIAGPCVIESEKIILKTAETLKKICNNLKINLIFKSSYDKANRSSLKSFRGPGLIKGLEILKKVKNKFDLPILVDVHKESEIKPASEIADILQIPAFLCRQTDLISETAKSNKIVNVKKGQFLAPWDMNNIINKIEHFKNKKILLTERGYCFGYNRWVVDMCSLYEMKKTGYPVIFDGTHSVQIPGGEGASSGGNREYISTLCKSSIAVGIAGLFLETHPNPDKALSDGKNMIKLNNLKFLLKNLKKIDDLIKKNEK